MDSSVRGQMFPHPHSFLMSVLIALKKTDVRQCVFIYLIDVNYLWSDVVSDHCTLFRFPVGDRKQHLTGRRGPGKKHADYLEQGMSFKHRAGYLHARGHVNPLFKCTIDRLLLCFVVHCVCLPSDRDFSEHSQLGDAGDSRTHVVKLV